jgi:hypothetical protein
VSSGLGRLERAILLAMDGARREETLDLPEKCYRLREIRRDVQSSGIGPAATHVFASSFNRAARSLVTSGYLEPRQKPIPRLVKKTPLCELALVVLREEAALKSKQQELAQKKGVKVIPRKAIHVIAPPSAELQRRLAALRKARAKRPQVVEAAR